MIVGAVMQTVGAVDIDSGWSTGPLSYCIRFRSRQRLPVPPAAAVSGFNNFIVDTTKFPDMGALVSELHDKNVNVILWATSMIDTDSSNYEVALNKSFFVKNAFNEFTTLKWWHGHGGLLDYTNPAALDWWHSQLDAVLKLGIVRCSLLAWFETFTSHCFDVLLACGVCVPCRTVGR